MRRVLFTAGCLLLLATACVREEVGPAVSLSGKQVTIRVAVPEEPYAKVSFTEEEGRLKMAWQETDCIRVISGETSEVYTISNIISDHVAEFTGIAVPGSSFDILYPGTYESVAAAEADATSPTQVGNGSTAHLRFRALLEGVDSYEEIAFKSSWATAHGGTFKQGAAVKLVVELPGGVSTLKRAGIGLGGQQFSLPLQGVDVSVSAQKLTAYLMLPWDDIALPDGSSVPLWVMDTDNEVYSRTLSISGDKQVMQGKMNSFGGTTAISGMAIQDFVSGNGMQENPFLIANARQLDNVHSALVAGQTRYFRLLNDIDAASIANWTPLITSPYTKSIDFEGAGYTIANLTSTDAQYASFSGVLNGIIRNVTFDGATISDASKVGVVGGFIGTTGVVGNCTNVHVRNSSVTGGGTNWAGGFAGEINTTGTLEGCSVENTTVTCASHVGEFAGAVRGQVATIRNCYTRNFTLSHTTTPADISGLGGFVGCAISDAVFENCYVEGDVSLSSTVAHGATVDNKTPMVAVGGFVGYNAALRPSYTDCYVEGANVSISGASETGGFVGLNDKSASFTRCRISNAGISGVYHLGGFLGLGRVSSGYEVPSIFTDCTVEGVTITQNLNSAGGSIHTGGFVGYSNQALSYIGCSVTGTAVSSVKAQNVGGFVGCTNSSGSNFQGCTVDQTSTVTGHADNVGGFVGWSWVPDAYKNCSSAAAVSNTGSNTGGFAGKVAGSAAFTRCSATGNVTNNAAYTGGFVGYAQNASFFACHYDNGTVRDTRSNANTQVGGFVGGAVSDVSLNGCYVSNATIDAASAGRTGGFAGQLGSDSVGGKNVTTLQCHVSGTNVDGGTNSGGFVGVQYERADQCYVDGGTVTAHNGQVGGFGAFIQNCSVTNCYTTATVAGGSYDDVGGFVGLLWHTDIQNCYSSGTQTGSGTNRGAFVARCALQGSPGSIANCIGWNASLPFCASNTVGATITNAYAGTEGTISGQADAQQGWSSSIWKLSGAQPLLLPGSTRIPAIFVGDSITWQWARVKRTDAQSKIIEQTHGALGNEPLPDYMSLSGSNITTYFHPGFFSGNGYIDKGISGQNTTQMRDRFNKDVLALNPRVFVLMGGTNDIAQGVDEDTIFGNIEWMAAQAKAVGIKVILCSVTPNNRNYTLVGRKAQYIEPLNVRIKALADATDGYVYCDYWSALVARDGDSEVAEDIDHGLKDIYKLYDDLHPGPAAYTVMEGIVKPLIDALLVAGEPVDGNSTIADLGLVIVSDEI